MAAREEAIDAAARAVGLARAGAAPLARLPREAFLATWLADGRAGEMRYLHERTATRLDPRPEFPWARSVIVAALRHPPPPPLDPDWGHELRGRIAAYALGLDYHVRLAAMLQAFAARLDAAFPGARFLSYVDTGPLLEREWATRAGLGWIGKHTLALDRERGSYFLLGELLTDLEVDAAPPPADHCGTCTRCLAACPTGALDAAYLLDPRRCISYLTIELRGPIPAALRPRLGNWIFGCDLCQQACPWNGDAATTWAHELTPHLPGLLALDEHGFRARYRQTAVGRAKRDGLVRNVAVALGNSGNPDAVPPLARALADDPAWLVRGHAAWALGALGGAGARAALARARGREADPRVTAENAAALTRAADRRP
jgi:epoxyqueuosine reductase